jgi:drug/metabolite transporter (DMT)-like permease
LAIKIGLESIPPFLGAAVRFLLAAIIMAGIVSIKKVRIPMDRIAIRLYLVAGFFTFSLGYAFVYWGQQYVPSALASILFGTFPFFVAALSWFVYRIEYLTWIKVTGVLIGFIGVVIIFSEDLQYHPDELSYLGMLAIIVAAIIQAFASVTVKKYGYQLSTFALVTVGMGIGTCVLFIISIATEDWSVTVLDAKAVGSVVYLATFGSIVTFGTMFWLLKRIEAVILSLSAFITPIIAVLLGIFIADEQFTTRILAGSGMVLIGILIANLRDLFLVFRRKKAPSVTI